MTKITVALLTVAAFIYAAFLVLAKVPLPQPRRFSGPRRRFVLATLLFVGLIGRASAMRDNPQVLCYYVAISPDKLKTNLAAALKAIWRTLDPNKSEKFRKKLEAAAGDGVIRSKTAEMLALAYSELAYHKERTRGKGPVATCYKMTPLGNALATTRENALKQLELLEEARKAGRIDDQTARKAHDVLAKQVEMMHRSRSSMSASDWRQQSALVNKYNQDAVTPGDSASVAAGIIVEMEDGLLPEFTASKRLAVMKQRIETLLSAGPDGNDWADPDIRPNVTAVLEKAGLIQKRPVVMCYDRAAAPVKARSDELKQLQSQLLDEKVAAGVIDAELAERAARAAADESAVDYATEADIRKYQKTVRRAIRLLYKDGELPSSFVEKIAEALDIEIIAFNGEKALRNDAGYFLQSLFWQPIGSHVIEALAKRKIIPPPRNHRLVMQYFGRGGELSDKQEKQLAEFLSLVDAGTEFDLPEDGNMKVQRNAVPAEYREYRLRIRTVCRALVKTALVKPDRLRHIEELIGIAILGKLQGD
ncbi:MAG: hypothetical protein JW720_09755 [Sedimentisphaerales bacterium]|nr:hypothetical protein [Sedimentisphaerales bacterium]